jgi:hypothetical protein
LEVFVIVKILLAVWGLLLLALQSPAATITLTATTPQEQSNKTIPGDNAVAVGLNSSAHADWTGQLGASATGIQPSTVASAALLSGYHLNSGSNIPLSFNFNLSGSATAAAGQDQTAGASYTYTLETSDNRSTGSFTVGCGAAKPCVTAAAGALATSAQVTITPQIKTNGHFRT